MAAGIGTAAALGAARWAYGFAFKPHKERSRDPYQLPGGKQYEHFKPAIYESVEKLEKMPCEWVSIKSRDGLKLAGRYYHQKDGAPLVLFFHGYRSPALRDFSGGFWIYRELGYNILMPDQRGHGQSEGEVITLGIRERYDCVKWVDYCVERFGPDVKILLGGISMGAATVLMAAELLQDCPNIKGILADCGYSTVEGIMKAVIKDMKLPVEPSWKLVKMGARIFGAFDVNESSAMESLRNNKIPVVFIHGEEDKYVPCRMTMENLEACASAGTETEAFIVPEAGHGMSFYMDREGYYNTVVPFVKKVLNEQ